jgi:phospholipid/cholesterol/gamma-HCH transport system substrate-binding protein
MLVFTVVTVALIGLLATLIGNITFTDRHTYSGRFTDSTGVLQGDRVRLSGVEVGRVQGVELVEAADGRQEALVTFEVDQDVPVLETARLELRYENIVGQRYLAIEEEAGTGSQMEPGDTFPVSQTSPALNLTQLFNGFQPLLRALDPDQTNELSYQLVRAFQGESTGIAQLLEDTASLTQTLADKDAVIGSVVTNLDQVLRTVAERDTELTALIVRFRDLMVGLDSDRETISVELPRLSGLLGETTDAIRTTRRPLARSVRGLGVVAEALRVDREELDDSLREIPEKLQLMARTGSYGSWFNFYVCGMEVRLNILGGTLYLGSPGLSANERDSVCGGADEVPPGYEQEGQG